MRPLLLLLACTAPLLAPDARAQGPCAGVHVTAFAPFAAPESEPIRVELFDAWTWDGDETAEPDYARDTDEQGDARFTGINVGDYVVRASRPGFRPAFARFSCLSATYSRLYLALARNPETSSCTDADETEPDDSARCSTSEGDEHRRR